MQWAWLVVGLGGAVGAVARYEVVRRLAVLAGPGGMAFPVATFLINAGGSFLMGLLAGLFSVFQLPPLLWAGLAVGVLGGFTTFSSFSLEVLHMLEQGDFPLAAAYICGSVLLGLLGVWIGKSAVGLLAL